MTPETVINIAQEALLLAIMITAPLLGTALLIGLIIGMFQAATQINEMTLSFIPKLLGLVMVIFIAGNWILTTLINYTQRLIESIPSLIG
ncbi:MAG TPA: flagellar biosynthesis protein FliQ [Gammaproteobacteria bacterium]|nr:flagellar biosynthesis protein FliQ [Gammaproteobacteria bacterium]